MVSEGTATAAPGPSSQHGSFFRQSGWLMVANILGGFMTLGVHLLNKRIPAAEYSIFGTLLMVTVFLPTLPLQMVFAQQTARALALGREGEVASAIRRASLGISVGWLVLAALVLAFRGSIMQAWEISDPWALVATLLAVWASLMMPLFLGVLQGQQDFLWVGLSLLLAGVGRVVVAAVLVLGFGGGATAMITGAFLGMFVGFIIAVWRTRHLWVLRGARMPGGTFLRQMGPLMLGFGVCQFMFTTDTMYAKAFFSGDDMKCYVAAGTLSRAVLWLVLPLAAVMFPKLVHSSVRSEKSNLLGVVVLGTAVLAVGGAAGLWLFGPLVIEMVYTAGDVSATMALLPWYAGAMIPLALANVMANDLLAHGRFKAVPAMVLVGLAYAVVLPMLLRQFPGRMEVVLQTLGGFNLLLLAVCGLFGFLATRRAPAPALPVEP